MSLPVPSELAAPALSEPYADLVSQLSGLLVGECDVIANVSNMASLIFYGLPTLNWAGFYFLHNDVLVLGPFQGKTACLRIPVGQGVCGTAVARRESILVADVHNFPGHIACDSASLSELVVPLIVGGRVIGVLDLDAPVLDRFGPADLAGCQALVACFLAHQRQWPDELRRVSD